MHEKIKIAKYVRYCDLCGKPILKGDKYRLVELEYNSLPRYEHISCPELEKISK